MIRIIDSGIRATRELVDLLEDIDNLISVSGIDMLMTLKNTSTSCYEVLDDRLHDSCLQSIVDDMRILAETRSSGYVDMYSDKIGLIRFKIGQGHLEAHECTLRPECAVDLSTLI
jgi:hypothetical protein